MKFASIVLASAFLFICVGACGGGDGTECETHADCGELLCGPEGRCHLGWKGDPCLASSQCAYSAEDGLFLACSYQAGSCVEVECRFHEDCTTGTCRDDLTCDPRICEGTPVPCAAIWDELCDYTEGCFSTSKCTGTVVYCPLLDGDSSGCAQQQGCTYDAGANKCNGYAYLCGTIETAESCEGQQGCSWEPGCEGTPVACSTFGIHDCYMMPGCSVTSP
jgi:hypothetical protein